MVGSALTTVLVAANTSGQNRGPSMWLSFVVTVASSVMASFKFREAWVSYRLIRDQLEREDALFQARADSYAKAADPQALFIDRVEAILKAAEETWTSLFIPKSGPVGGTEPPPASGG